MRRLAVAILVVLAGCRHCPVDVLPEVEARVAAVAPARPAPAVLPCAAPAAVPAGPLDLPALWDLALANNPDLREAAAEVEAARGRLIQAGKYPNPRLVVFADTLGNQVAPAGTLEVEINQEIVTAGKRRLDQAVAARDTDAARLELLGRKFEVLTRVRRGYYDYAGWRSTIRVQDEVVAALRQAVEVARKQVEVAMTRPRTDVLRLEALLREAEVERDAARGNLTAAWHQLAAAVGVPDLPPPPDGRGLPGAAPRWDEEAVVGRVQAVHTDLKRAAAEAERARLAVERACAEAVPNVTLGGGFDHEYVDRVEGVILSVETALPVWDRKQGQIHEARARLTQALAAQRTAATRLSREVAEAYGRYQAARLQAERLTAEVLPVLVESLALVRKGYAAGAEAITFADVIQAEQTLNQTRLRVAEARRTLWLAVADLEGLMQLDLDEEGPPCPGPDVRPR